SVSRVQSVTPFLRKLLLSSRRKSGSRTARRTERRLWSPKSHSERTRDGLAPALLARERLHPTHLSQERATLPENLFAILRRGLLELAALTDHTADRARSDAQLAGNLTLGLQSVPLGFPREHGSVPLENCEHLLISEDPRSTDRATETQRLAVDPNAW